VEAIDRLSIWGLEGDVKAGGRLSVIGHEQLVGREPFISPTREFQSKRCERAGVEPLACVEIGHP
jgi:hypothetical protein